MTIIETIAPTHAFTQVSTRLGRLASSILVWWETTTAAQQVTMQLDRLDDHRLDDLGLVRHSRQVGWTVAVRGLDPTPVFRSVYGPGERQ